MTHSKILNVWQTGCFTDQEISETLNVTHYSIRQALVAHGKPVSTALSLELKLELKDMYDNAEVDNTQEDLQHLAEELGCSDQAIRNAFLGAFDDGTALSQRMTRDDAIREELAKGVPQKIIAEMFGVSQATVSKLNPMPIKRPRGKRMRDADWVELLSQYPRFTITELAQMYGISRASIYNRINKNGH